MMERPTWSLQDFQKIQVAYPSREQRKVTERRGPPGALSVWATPPGCLLGQTAVCTCVHWSARKNPWCQAWIGTFEAKCPSSPGDWADPCISPTPQPTSEVTYSAILLGSIGSTTFAQAGIRQSYLQTSEECISSYRA